MHLRGYTVLAVVAAIAVLSNAQGQPQLQTQTQRVTVNGKIGVANVVQINGHTFVDIEALARIANGSIGFAGKQIMLTVPAATGTENPASTTKKPVGLSREFMRAGVEELGAMREWVSTLSYVVRSGYPTRGNWVDVYRGRVADRHRQVSVSVVTPSDRQSMQLLQNHYNNLQSWSSGVVSGRNGLNAELTINSSAVESDPLFQKINACSQFLTSMLASGQFEDYAACH